MRFNQPPISQIALLGVCSGLGQKQEGLEAGPGVRRESGISAILSKSDAVFFDLGHLKPEKHEDIKGWNSNERVRAKANQSLQAAGVLCSLGGDHSISIGTVQATMMAYPNARVIWIDAYGGANTPQTSLSGNLHGMPIAELLGLFKTPIGGPLLSPPRLLIVGVRDLNTAEKIFFDKLNIDFISSEEINFLPSVALREVKSWLKKEPEVPVHLSFDVDVLDPSYAPAESRHELNKTIHCAKSTISSTANLKNREYEL